MPGTRSRTGLPHKLLFCNQLCASRPAVWRLPAGGCARGWIEDKFREEALYQGYMRRKCIIESVLGYVPQVCGALIQLCGI